MTNHFDEVQAAQLRRVVSRENLLNGRLIAKQIVAQSGNDQRIACDFLDTLTALVNEELRRTK